MRIIRTHTYIKYDNFYICLTYRYIENLRSLYLNFKSVKKCKETHKPIAYVIDGKTLSYVLKFNFDQLFRDICMMCDAVLCCRMSPSQKAEVKHKFSTKKNLK